MKQTARDDVPSPAPKAEPLVQYPVDSDPQRKLNDFRLNPPAVEEMFLKPLQRPSRQGKSLLVVKFAPDRRLTQMLTLRPDDEPFTLFDDGTHGDEVAGDRAFSAVTDLDVDSLARQQNDEIAAMGRKNKPIITRQFKGREISNVLRPDMEQIRRLLNDRVLKLIPVGGGVVDEKKSLVVTDLSVIENPDRTFNPCTGVGTSMGKWTFGYLMQQMANEPLSGINASDFTLRWLRRWVNNQTVNDFTVGARPAMQAIINRWPKLPDGRLDLARAPMKLLAIVNRIDLATNPAYGRGNAGEGRFVFGVIDTSGGACNPMRFTIIFEYGVPKHTCSEVKAWAQQWLDLDAHALGSPAYNAALEAITEQFAHANAAPTKPNGSALNQLRTDEIALAGPWELREFRVAADDSDAGHLREVTVKQTPSREQYNSGGPQVVDLATWINGNTAALKIDKHTVPLTLPPPSLAPFLAGAIKNDIDFWNAPGIADLDARFHLSLNTCNACHGRETDTPFLHISVAPFGSEAQLSGFMKGDGTGGPLVVNDPVAPGVTHAFFDLERRAQFLHDVATKDCRLLIRLPMTLMTH